MTVTASGPAPDIAPLERPHTAQSVPVLVQTPLGAVVAGTLNGDVIILSARALTMLRAGAFVRALLLRGLESLRRTIVVAKAQRIFLEDGFYRPA